MAGDGVDVRRRVGRAADAGVDPDGVLESRAGQDIALGRRSSRTISTAPFAGGGRPSPCARGRVPGSPRSRAGSCPAPRQRVHGGGRAHGVAMPERGGGGADAGHELLVVDLARREEAAALPHHRAGACALCPSTSRRAWARPRARWRAGRPWPRPSAWPGWSCRSRWSAPRRRSGSRAAPRPGRDRRGSGRAPPSGACPSPGSGGPGIRAARRRHRGSRAFTRSARNMWILLQGARSEPVCAIPMIGAPGP